VVDGHPIAASASIGDIQMQVKIGVSLSV